MYNSLLISHVALFIFYICFLLRQSSYTCSCHSTLSSYLVNFLLMYQKNMIPHFIILPTAALLLLLHGLSDGKVVDNVVLDTKGRSLKANSMYYILPATQGQGGGLMMLPRNRTSHCPHYVSQLNLDIFPGLPLWFLPENPKQKRVSISSDVNILFNVVNSCLQSAAWQIIVDRATKRKYVGTGGVIGSPGEETVRSWFKIEKVKRNRYGLYQYDYKIVYCPNVCSFCMVMCGDIGVFVLEDGSRFLGLSDHPFYVMFKKA